MRFIDYKNVLNLIVTQNIDCLDNKTNISKNKIIFAHGNILEGHCSNRDCNNEIDIEILNMHVRKNKVLYCEKCNSPCKHKIVFYGEALPQSFRDNFNVRI